MTLEQLRIFSKVVAAGGFTAAAELLGTQKSYPSRVVAQLEAELGVKLLARTTRSLSVTETGQAVYERAVGLLAAAEDTVRMAQRTRAAPQGRLRITCGVEFGMIAVGHWVQEFLATHAEVSAEVEYTSRVVDLVHEGFDLAVRVGPVAESRLVARPLGDIEYGLFASPGYLQQRGLPLKPEALAEHSLVMFSTSGRRRGWALQREGATAQVDGPARLRVNNSFAVADALLQGLGIGMLPLLIAREHVAAARLKPVLRRWQPAAVPVHVVYPSQRYLSPKVRSFIDLALQRFPHDNLAARRAAAGPATKLPSPHRADS
jgi:LysR family transcriptional regulator, regulator for bpeEF and oprC